MPLGFSKLELAVISGTIHKKAWMNEKDMNLGATVEREKWIEEVENGISVEHKHLGKSKELQ